MSKKENYFILETFDDEINMLVQFQYWTSEKGYCYSNIVLENGRVIRNHKRVSEQEYITAYETYRNV